MKTATKSYLLAVILPGILAVAWSVMNWETASAPAFAAYCGIAALFAVTKIKLPGLAGTYSLSFIPVLYGVSHFTSAEVIAAAAVAGLAGSMANAASRGSLAKAAFNTANLSLSATACLLAYHFAGASVGFLPALYCLLVTLYFVVNTLLVSGVISLSDGKALSTVWEAWYLWSFIYYLAGATALGLAMSATSVGPEWLILAPLGYMIWFFWTLRTERRNTARPASGAALPAAAKQFVTGVIAAGAIVLGVSLGWWAPVSATRFVAILVAAMIAGAFKVRLPGMGGNVSTSFVVILFAVAELQWAGAVMIALAATLVQTYWRASRTAQPVQVAFNLATVAMSTSAAMAMSRGISFVVPVESGLVLSMLAATAVYYACNTAMVCTVLGLVENKTMTSIWDNCRFWSLPYFLVGTAVSGIMVAGSRAAGYPAALLMLTIMGLVFTAFTVHVKQARTATANGAQ